MPECFEFEVSLEEIRPPVWRRFLLSGDATFEDLHRAIQSAFGWDGDHVWDFSVGARRTVIAGPSGERECLDDEPAACDVALASFFTPGGPRKCRYIYDFGDMWRHAVVLKRRRDEPGPVLRRLVGGGRACPQEDAGGLAGYYDACTFLETGRHPHMSAEEFRATLGDWRPDAYDLEAARRAFDRDAAPERKPARRRVRPKGRVK